MDYVLQSREHGFQPPNQTEPTLAEPGSIEKLRVMTQRFCAGHLRTGRSIIGLARSVDGFEFNADPQPFLTPEQDGPFASYEEFGVEDPRVTRVEDDYLITYSAYSRNGVRIALAKTKDFAEIPQI